MSVTFTRIKHNDLGQTSFELRSLPIQESGSFGSLTQYFSAGDVGFWSVEPGYEDTHNAIRRQLVVLGGDFSVKTTDGSITTFSQGDFVLAEDTSGDGHHVTSLGNHRAVSVFCVLNDQGYDQILKESQVI